MAPSILLATQLGQDYINVPASQNVWLAGMAEGFVELGHSVHIPWTPQGAESLIDQELEWVRRRFAELYGVGSELLHFFDSRELTGKSLPHRFDAVWVRDPALLSMRVRREQVRIAEYHGGAKEATIPEVTRNASIPLVTVTRTWAERFGAEAVAEPGALRVFFDPPGKEPFSSGESRVGIYVGGLDPDRIDGVGVRALRQLVSSGVSLDVVGGNLAVEVDILRWRMGRRRDRVRFYGYAPPAIAARMMHRSDFAVALKAEHSAPSAPIKLIAFAAAGLPLIVSSAFLRPDYSGETARTLRATVLRPGANPSAGQALEAALSSASEDTRHNYRIALDNTYARRIEKTGLLKLLD